MEDNFWEATQKSLQGDLPIVNKPKLTEALLKKPPFRFLHDVISEMQRNTGFASGLYSGAELDAKAIQDKEGKMSYLQKMIDFVSSNLGEPVPAKPAKIVAGLEPEATNVFLQMLARAATAQPKEVVASQVSQLTPDPILSSQQQSAQVSSQQQAYPQALISQQPSADQAAEAMTMAQSDAVPSTSGANPEVGIARPVHRPTRSTSQSADATGTAGDAEPSSTRGLADIIQRSLPRQASGKQAPQVDALAKQLTGLSTAQQDASTALMTSTQLPQQQPSFTAGAAVPTRPERPTSARRGPPKIPQTGSAGRPQTPSGGMARPGTSSGRPGSALRQPAQNAPATLAPSNTIQDEEEPAAAEPRAPRQTITSARPGLAMLPGARPASAGLKRPASAAGRGPAVALIEEGEEQEDEAEILVVTETMPSTVRSAGAGTEGQGALVRNILQAEKALQDQVSKDGAPAEQQGTGIVLRRKKRDDSSSSKAGDALAIAEMVQKLCQSTNPLARCVEYLQEDLETMTAEYNLWAEERKLYQDKLVKQQQGQTDGDGSRMHLADLDGQLEAAEQRILSLKKTVIQNDMTIQKLLRMSVGVV